MSRRKLFRELSTFDGGLKKERQEIAGVLGIPLGGARVVEVENRNSYVYVRLRESQNEVIQAFNDEVAPVYDLPVIVTRDGGRYKVIGRDTQRYENWGSSSAYLPKHGNSHSRNPHISSGGDVVWVYSNQFTPLLAQPSGTNGSAYVSILENLYLQSDGTWRFDDLQATSSLLVSKPTNNQARMLLVYMDTADGTLHYSTGTLFPATTTGTADIAQYIPSLSNTTYEPIVAVRLLSGTSAIGWDNLYDVRQWFGRGGTNFTGSTVGAYEEGALRGQVTAFDFVGPNVDVTVSGTRARVYISGTAGGGGGGGGAIVFQDEGSFLITGTVLNFVGDGVSAALNGSVVDVTIPGGGGGRTLISGSYPDGSMSSVTFQVPSGYDKLEIEMMARVASTASGTKAVYLDINGDTTAGNYWHQELYGYSSNQHSSADDNFTNTFGYIPGKGTPSGSFGWLRIEIPFYDKGTFFKIGQWHFAMDAVSNPGALVLNMMQGQGATVWKNLNPITSLVVRSSQGNFVTGTIINFYGL